MAQELIKLGAARQAHPGHPFGADSLWQQEFEAAFPYQETPINATPPTASNGRWKSRPRWIICCAVTSDTARPRWP